MTDNVFAEYRAKKLGTKSVRGSGEIHDINENTPHAQGPAICLGCNHKWVAVLPVGLIDMECPNCGLIKGVFKGLTLPSKTLWSCVCGCPHFFLNEDYSFYCCLCGLEQSTE